MPKRKISIRRKYSPAAPVVDWDDETDQDDAKDLWHFCCEPGKFMEARVAFSRAGYRIRGAELVAFHPLWTFRLFPKTAPRIADAAELRRHLLNILETVDVFFRDEEVRTQAAAGEIFVSILWPTPARGKRRAAAWDEFHPKSQIQKLPYRRRPSPGANS